MNPISALTLTPNPIDKCKAVEVIVPGSKSYTIRALLLAAMTPQPVTIQYPLLSDDTRAMQDCLNRLGIKTELKEAPVTEITVSGSMADVPSSEVILDCDLSAASLRFLLAFCTALPGVQTVQGKDGLNRRPVRDLVDALRQLGADIVYLEREGYPPVQVRSSTLTGHEVTVSGSVSSQYLSALTMLAPMVGGLSLQVTGELLSRPYMDMTIGIMRDFGVEVAVDETPESDLPLKFTVAPDQHYRMDSGSYIVEGDASAAAYPLAAATLTGGTVVLKNLPATSIQADMAFITLLEDMGNRVERHPDRIVYEGCAGVRPSQANMENCPDQAQTMAVLLAFAKGKSRLEGLKSLRVKETDRLSAVANELTKMGIRVQEDSEALTIYGGNPQPNTIATYGDHRMAMAFAVSATRLDGLHIQKPAVVNKTYPRFWDDCPAWGIGIKERLSGKPVGKIVLVGFMGAGKSHIGHLLANALDIPYLDTDSLAVALTERDSVSDIFDLDGEMRFRELELQVARSLSAAQDAVISTGGGLVMNKLAIDYLRSQDAHVIYLEAELGTILQRLEAGCDGGTSDESPVHKRPLLRDHSAVKLLYALRMPLYRFYASLCVKTDDKRPEAVLKVILDDLASEKTTPSACHSA